MYIEPNIKLYNTFSDLKNDKNSEYFDSIFKEEKITINNLFKCDRLFVLAEPGFGKTVLLENLVKNAGTNGFEAIFVDLKSLDSTESLIKNIEKFVKRKGIVLNIIDKPEILLCLDALDEVSINNFGKIIEIIKDFIVDFPNVKIFISCRTLYFEKYANLLNNLNFTCLNIQRFSNNNIFEYLNENKIDLNKQELIKRYFFESYYASILYTPRYLELLVKYIKENKSKDINNITRCELFEYFIYQKIDKDKNIQKKVDVNILKRVIETLALVMEIYQVNTISKDELMSFFADIQNDLKYNILSHITIEIFIERSVLKDNIDFVEFENSEFQEYLAAKEISRFKDLKQSTFDLAVNSEFKEIYPSWFNVLSFLVELNIDLLKDILNYGMANQKNITEGYFDLITKVNSNLLSVEIRDEIFKKVFLYHQINNIYLKFDLEYNLSYYYTQNNSGLIKEYFGKALINKENLYLIRNIFHIIYYICERGELSQKDILFWTKKYENLFTDINTSVDIKRNIIKTVKYLKNNNIINEIIKLPYNEDEYLWESVINGLSKAKINENIFVNLIINGLKFRKSLIIHYLCKIKSKKSLKTFFKIITNNAVLLNDFHDNYSNRNDSEGLITFLKNLKDNIDNEFLKLLKNFVIKSCDFEIHINHNSYILRKLANCISSIDREFIFEFIDKISVSEDFSANVLVDIFKECLYLEQIQKFIKTLNDKLPKYYWLSFDTLYNFKYSNGIDAKEIFEEGNKYFSKEYEGREKRNMEFKNDEEKREIKLYDDFIKLLNISTEKKYVTGIFSDFASEHIIINKYIKADEKTKFEAILVNFLSSFDPLSSGLVIENENGNRTSFRISKYIYPYGDAIICANILYLNISNFRQNIINYIPFAFDEHFSAINNIIEKISETEFEPLIDVYIGKKDDLWRFKPNNFFYLIDNYPDIISKLESVLIDYLEEKDTKEYKIESLKILDNYYNDAKYLNTILRKYKDNKGICNVVNSILISKYLDKRAIKKRINDIIKNPFKFTYSNEAEFVGAEENELTNKYFASPLMGLKEKAYLENYLMILQKSFTLQNKDIEYFEYAKYMREIVIAYFNNLKYIKDINILRNLEQFCIKFSKENGYGILLNQISWLKKEYLEYIGKPENINTCINKYNNIKDKQYSLVNDNWQLCELLKDIIEKDLNDWIKVEGRKMLDSIKSKGKIKETELQNLLALKFDNLLQYKGIRKNDFYITMESKNLDDSRTDFLIGYGFISPVLIELKLSSNTDMFGSDLSTKKSFKNMKKYVQIYNSENSIFLVYENKKRGDKFWKNHLRKIDDTYSKIKGVTVIGIPI